MNTDATPTPNKVALCGNSVTGLFRFALDPTVPTPHGQNWQPPTPEHLAALLPQYRITGLLGRGGMGAVYQGIQASLNRPVAIKLLPAELAVNTEFITRFQREAQTLAQLQHPGIVAVHDFGQTSEGHLFFIMEFVNGTDLQQIIHGAGLDPKQALEVTIQICEALHYAHSQGVIHRDIKPANVLLTKDGRAKLADFGLARPLTALDGSVTAASLVMGTPDYMAPEQWMGKADHRADIYSLGVMLYEMLTGQRPQGAFDLPSQRAQTDVRLDDVVIKAMRQEPNRRYQQVSELRQAVEKIQTTQPQLPEQAPAAVNGAGMQESRMDSSDGKQRVLRTRRGMWLAPAVAAAFALSLLGYLAWLTIDHDPHATDPGTTENNAQASGATQNQADKNGSESSTAPNGDAPKSTSASAPVAVTNAQAPSISPAKPEDPPVVATAPSPSQSLALRPEVATTPATATVASAPMSSAPPPKEAPSVATPAPPPAVISVFSTEAQNALAWVSVPLDETVPADIRQNLIYLREDLVDEGKARPAASIDAYRAAYYLCEAMLAALGERETARVAAGYRAAQSAANQKNSNEALDVRRNYMMSWPQHARETDQRAELQRQSYSNVTLASEAQKVAWAARVEKLRNNQDGLYRQFRAAMR